MIFSSPCFIILSLFVSLPFQNAQIPSDGDQCHFPKEGREDIHSWQVGSHVEDIDPEIHSTFPKNLNSGLTTNPRSWHTRSSSRRRHHLRNAHGILNIIGWGTFLPIGVIIARYYRNLPMKYKEWYSLHILCQISGFILGTIGWGIGMKLGNASETHRILSTIVFILATTQVFAALFLQPKEDDKYRKYWEVQHYLLGYVLIALIIVNIFQGISNQKPAEKWKWSYVGLLGVLASTAVALEILKWIEFIKHRRVVLNNNSYNTSS